MENYQGIITMSTPISYPICGNCLHAKSSHEVFNHSNQYMYCGACFNLCPTNEFNFEHKPSSPEIIYTLSSKRIG